MTHGRAERNYQAVQAVARLPPTGFVHCVVHINRPADPALVTAVNDAARSVFRRHATVGLCLGVPHWSYNRAGRLLPHLHIIAWVQDVSGLLANDPLTRDEIALRCDRLLQPPRARGRPRNSEFITKTSPVIGGGELVRVEPLRDGLVDGRPAEAFVRYLLRTTAAGDGRPVEPGHRLMYGLAKAKRVYRPESG